MISAKDKKEIVEAVVKEMKPVITDTITTVVNGKIDRMQKGLDEHMELVEPLVEGWNTVQNGRRAILWVTSLVAAVGGAIVAAKAGLDILK